jgi:hypothetical protein
MTSTSYAHKNEHGFWQLHIAGGHDPEANTCDLEIVDIFDVIVDAPASPGRYDIYIMGADLGGIAHSRFGLHCNGSFLFYGWTTCSDAQIPSAGWPGCDEGVTLTWGFEQPPGHVTMGILDVYVYGGPAILCASPDPRVGYGEWCDATVPDPLCYRTANPCPFGCVGFGYPGYLATECGMVPVERSTWGSVKALYSADTQSVEP